MKQEDSIAKVVCWKSDAKVFKKAGFVESPNTGAVCLDLSDSDQTVSAMMEVFNHSVHFVAKLGRTDSVARTLIPSDRVNAAHPGSGQRLIKAYCPRFAGGNIGSDVPPECRWAGTVFIRLASDAEVPA